MNVRFSGFTLALPRLNFVCELYVILCIVKLLMFSFDCSILEDFLGFLVMDFVCYNARSDNPIPFLANFLLRIFISPDSCTMYIQKKTNIHYTQITRLLMLTLLFPTEDRQIPILVCRVWRNCKSSHYEKMQFFSGTNHGLVTPQRSNHVKQKIIVHQASTVKNFPIPIV